MSEEERSAYHQEADHLKTLHSIQHPGYKFQPKQASYSLSTIFAAENHFRNYTGFFSKIFIKI
jgi:hypothetical protein